MSARPSRRPPTVGVPAVKERRLPEHTQLRRLHTAHEQALRALMAERLRLKR